MSLNEAANYARPEIVERHFYNGLFIEIELYRNRNGGYEARAYIVKETLYSMVKRHFPLTESIFETKQAAMAAAIIEGQMKIDSGFDPAVID